MLQRKKIALFGATGSIGENTLQVIAKNKDLVEVVAIAAKSKYEKLAVIAKEYSVKKVALYDEDACLKAKESGLFSADTEFFSGIEGLMEIATLPEVESIVMAIVGTLGLKPTLAAIHAKKNVLLASKEVLVLAGKFVMEAVRKNNTHILPLDSEHNAIFQCLDKKPIESIDKIILTASGGPFRKHTPEEMLSITVEKALKHPNWDMGAKITLDCATLANKGLELIEAHWLFNMPSEKIDIVVHPQSIIHSMVQFIDGSILAQMCPPQMTFAIQNMLFYPERRPSVSKPFNFLEIHQLELHPPDTIKFPCLRLARESLEASGCAPAIFNASNEVAVEAFINKQISFLQISEIIDKTLEKVRNFDPEELEEVLEVDREARKVATTLVKSL